MLYRGTRLNDDGTEPNALETGKFKLFESKTEIFGK